MQVTAPLAEERGAPMERAVVAHNTPRGRAIESEIRSRGEAAGGARPGLSGHHPRLRIRGCLLGAPEDLGASHQDRCFADKVK